MIDGAVFDHAAHAAPRMADLLAIYRDQLGGELLYGGDNTRVGYRGVVLGFRGGGKVELLQPLPGSTFLDSFFARHPLGGLHHLTFRVDDLGAAVDRARDGGFTVIGENHDDPNWREAFLHPRSAGGVLIQFVQAPVGHPARMDASDVAALLTP